MNPFALHGLDFLAFYAAVGVVVIGLLYVCLRLQGSSRMLPQLQMTDPYQIAYLRAGTSAALRVAALSLVDRGLLRAGGTTLLAEANAERMVRRPIEKAVLRCFREPDTAKAMLSDPLTQEACREYHDTLESFGLIVGRKTIGRRLIPFLGATMVLVFVGSLKIDIALSEGRHNIGFTILMMGGFVVVAIKILLRHRTRVGDNMLADLEAMFARLRDRADTLREGGATNEAALLAAVFGLGALSPERFPGIYALKRTNSSSSSGCGSSCSGGGCGRGCGGGCGG